MAGACTPADTQLQLMHVKAVWAAMLCMSISRLPEAKIGPMRIHSYNNHKEYLMTGLSYSLTIDATRVSQQPAPIQPKPHGWLQQISAQQQAAQCGTAKLAEPDESSNVVLAYWC